MRPDTPLAAAVRVYLERNPARLHMPGHKGRSLFPVGEAARWDVTEVEGTDSLYEAAEAIAESERRFSALYGSAASFLSAGGSTLCIQAMLALACPPGSTVIAARGVHGAAVNAMALLDLRPVWLWPEGGGDGGVLGPVAPGQVEAALETNPGAAAVYLTSPNYLGVLSDVEGIGRLCRARGVPLLVDNAHGAHLKWLPGGSLHPMDQGADLCCDSLHKTLPALTGAALLHVGRGYGENAPYVKGKMALFGSTSPSYLILLSADGLLGWLEEEAPGELARVAERVAALEGLATDRGFGLLSGRRDPIRLTLDFGAAGYSSGGFGRRLRELGVEPEFLGGRHAVLLAGCGNGEEDYRRVERALEPAVRPGQPEPDPEAPPRPRRALSLREAALAPWERVKVEAAVGRVAGAVSAPCPPGIPVLVPGEAVDRGLAAYLKRTGVFEMNVIK